MVRKLDNMEKVLEHICESLENLEKGKIDVVEMGIIAKSSEAIMSSLKIQLSYAGMRNEKPNIPFLQKCNHNEKIIECKNETKKLDKS